MKYSLKQITVFDAVASMESVSAAARKLSMTQSAVSMSLGQLENLLGRPLFIRQGNRLTLSHWGNWLRPKARRLLQDAQHIELGLHEQHLISGKFRLCSSQTAAEHLIPELISKIDTDFPELRIDLMVENTENVIDGLLNYEFDLGIIEGRNDDTRLHQERWIDDHLVVFSSPHHPYAKCEMTSLSQLEQAKWVLREQGAGTRRIFEGAIHGIIEKLNVWKEYEQVSVLKSLVKHGQYISSLPFLDVEKEVANGELVILQTPQLNMQRHLSFIWRADSGENPLRDCIITEARRLSRNRQMKK
ncbi:LysR family transcriptional regulator [Shewanella hanedai]|jgi:DNA-binding transcriptional LysR family regulator|uniref:LysR family transcriptional regulator n=1 Tax=Shewanella hanedai TaxID=25 RepID=A0A553JMD7_SHEHA|nr:LysR substrate-binding domain-containing protein [Shewanella hanedai]TRY13616.1 LysR family transcriptional regulator [Shewanella hanedai]GGI97773.1 LysR family transcriptional regulator [Shewanella hanedai]